MGMAISQEIRAGSLVGLKRFDRNPDVRERLELWIAAYGRGPFLVHSRPTLNHVVLEDQSGKAIHFGSTEDTSLHIGYVESWRP